MDNILSVTFEYAVSFLQSMMFVIFCYKFFEPKFKKSVNIICCLMAIVFMFAVIIVQNKINIHMAFSEILFYCAIMLPYSLLCLKGKWYLKMAIPLFGYGICLCVSLGFSYFSSVLLGLDGSSMFGFDSFIYRVVMTLVVNLTCIFLFFLIIKIFKDKIRLKSYTDILFFLIVPVFTVVVMLLTFSIAMDARTPDLFRIYLGIISLVMFTVAVLVLSAMVRVTKSNELKTQNLLMRQEQQMYKEEIDNANEYIKEIAKVKHDMKNQIFCIREMLDSDNIQEAQKICNSISLNLKETPEIFNSSNIYLNSILNVIYKKAREKGIDISVIVTADFKEIDGSDLITMVGNLCDNAIEALQKQSGDKILRIIFSERGGFYILSVKNHIEDSVLSENPNLESNKDDSLYHGHGINSVKTLVKKYNGNLKFSEEDKMFIVRLILEVPNSTK